MIILLYLQSWLLYPRFSSKQQMQLFSLWTKSTKHTHSDPDMGTLVGTAVLNCIVQLPKMVQPAQQLQYKKDLCSYNIAGKSAGVSFSSMWKAFTCFWSRNTGLENHWLYFWLCVRKHSYSSQRLLVLVSTKKSNFVPQYLLSTFGSFSIPLSLQNKLLYWQ